MGEINVVPFIDVMLVLLVVFMVTAPLLNQGIEVELPEANNEPLAIDENLETLVVSLTAEGEYFISVLHQRGCYGGRSAVGNAGDPRRSGWHHHQYEPEHTGSG